MRWELSIRPRPGAVPPAISDKGSLHIAIAGAAAAVTGGAVKG